MAKNTLMICMSIFLLCFLRNIILIEALLGDVEWMELE